MTGPLAALSVAFRQRDPRLAVFDRALRQYHGLWERPDAVDVGPIVDRFAARREFTDSEGRIVVPLHADDRAEPTGQYLVCMPNHVVPCVVYYDFSAGQPARIPFDRFPRTYPATRIRYWHPDATPPSQPSFLPAGTRLDGQSDASAAATSTASGTSAASEASAGGSGGQSRATPVAHAEGAGPEQSQAAAARTDTAAPDVSDPTASEPDDVFAVARAFLDREREAERAEAREAFERLPPSQFCRRHAGIADAVLTARTVDRQSRQRITFQPSTFEGQSQSIPETYGLYHGNEVLVAPHDDTEGFPVRASVVEVDDDAMTLDVVVDWETSSNKSAAEAATKPATEATFAIGQSLNPVPYDREAAAIETVAATDRKAAVLNGDRAPGFASALEGLATFPGLNEYQEQAARTALRAEDLYCIHGPPGTGKTRTLVAIIRAAVADGQKVLACAHSNQAVDNLLVGKSTAETADPTSVYGVATTAAETGTDTGDGRRAGGAGGGVGGGDGDGDSGGDRVGDDGDGGFVVAREGDNSDNDVVASELADVPAWKANVVGATTSGAHRFESDQFDLAVVDEATQAGVPASLIPVDVAKRVVLAGDHRQLPPYTSGETDPDESMGVSLFERLVNRDGEQVTTLLRRQYRMNRVIADFVNDRFYDGDLVHGKRNRDWRINDIDPFVGIHVDGSEQGTPSNSYANDPEAKAVVREVSALLHRGAGASDIGVITPYSGQIARITSRLNQLDPEVARDVTVDTVDSFQGGEREAIVLSLVRSNDRGSIGFLGFPHEGPRRLNVALTRAQKRCTVVADWDTFRASDAPAAPHYRALYEYLRNDGVTRTFGD